MVHAPGIDLRARGRIEFSCLHGIYEVVMHEGRSLNTDIAAAGVTDGATVVIIVCRNAPDALPLPQHNIPVQGIIAGRVLSHGGRIIDLQCPQAFRIYEFALPHPAPDRMIVHGDASAGLQLIGKLLGSLCAVPVAIINLRRKPFLMGKERRGCSSPVLC